MREIDSGFGPQEGGGGPIDRQHHTYPSNYPPGTHWAVDAGWEILDIVKPGVIQDDVRFMLAGMIAGRLMRERDETIIKSNKS